MKDLRNIIADNKRVAEKASHLDKEDTGNNLVDRLVQVAEPLDEYAGMIGRVLSIEPYDGNTLEAIIDFSNSPFVNAGVSGEYFGEVKEQVIDLFPLDEL